MTCNAGARPPRRRALALGLCASVLAATTTATTTATATATPAPGAGASAGHSSASASPHAASPARSATVMTRNLYLGADLGPILAALATGKDAAIVGAATRTWAAVQATRPEERMAAIADEIVAADPAVVGLQEVTTWTTAPLDPRTGAVGEPVVAYDFLDLLLDELAARGADYQEVKDATAVNFASPAIPVLEAPDAVLPTRVVRLADRDVILARSDVGLANARTGTYENVVRFPVGDAVLPVARGWGSVDVRVRRAELRFVNSHLEAFGIPGLDAEQLRVQQVDELLAAQDALAEEVGELPVVYVGDYNSQAPDAPAYARLVAGVGRDAWTRNHRRDAGETCCFDDTLRDPLDPLTSRIDLVLHSDDIKAPRAHVVGEEAGDRTPSGLWPSDHAGVVARLVFPAATQG
jgi:endonuclease/exonuclease/phosphatase family metal-dependent hydrolase